MAFLPDAPLRGKRPDLLSVLTLARRPNLLRPSLLQALVHLADFAASFTFIPILARQKGASDVTVSLLLSINLAMQLLGNFISAGWADKIGRRQTATIGFLILAAGVGGCIVAPSLPYIFAFQLLIGFGLGLGYPLFMGLSLAGVSAQQRTTAMGLHQSIYSIGMFAGPWLGGILASRLGIPAMFAVISALTLVLGLAGSAGLESRQKEVPVSNPAA
jgi:MFS family permease